MWKLLAILIRLGIGLLLTYVTLSFLIALARTPIFQQAFVAMAFLLLGLWLVWSKLPEWLQDALRRSVKRRRRDDDD
jgi:hypothetical protein